MRNKLISKVQASLDNLKITHKTEMEAFQQDPVYAMKWNAKSILCNQLQINRLEWYLSYLNETEDEAKILLLIKATLEDSIKAALFQQVGSSDTVTMYNARVMFHMLIAKFFAQFLSSEKILLDEATQKLVALIHYS